MVQLKIPNYTQQHYGRWYTPFLFIVYNLVYCIRRSAFVTFGILWVHKFSIFIWENYTKVFTVYQGLPPLVVYQGSLIRRSAYTKVRSTEFRSGSRVVHSGRL
jgi:hypothetical protein